MLSLPCALPGPDQDDQDFMLDGNAVDEQLAENLGDGVAGLILKQRSLLGGLALSFSKDLFSPNLINARTSVESGFDVWDLYF